VQLTWSFTLELVGLACVAFFYCLDCMHIAQCILTNMKNNVSHHISFKKIQNELKQLVQLDFELDLQLVDISHHLCTVTCIIAYRHISSSSLKSVTHSVSLPPSFLVNFFPIRLISLIASVHSFKSCKILPLPAFSEYRPAWFVFSAAIYVVIITLFMPLEPSIGFLFSKAYIHKRRTLRPTFKHLH